MFIGATKQYPAGSFVTTSASLQVLQKAVCPEKRVGIDSAVSAIASVTEVEVSSDLAIAKIYLSVFSDDQGKSIAMAGLKRLEGYVRKHIATSMNLRLAPEIRFFQDDTIERAEQASRCIVPVSSCPTLMQPTF